MLRHTVAVLVGVVVIAVGVAAVDVAGLWLYPLPDGMRFGETPMDQIIASRPLGAKLFNFVLRLPACALGAFAAARLSRTARRRNALITSGALVAFVVYGATTAPFPLWATLAAVVLFPLCGLAGSAAAAPRDRYSMTTS